MPRKPETQKNEAGKEKRKPVRRDPEKRRQQNIQAQRKYREKLRERLDRLEALAASAVESRAAKKTPPGQTSVSIGLSETGTSSSGSSGGNSAAGIPPDHTSVGTVPAATTTPKQSQQLDSQLGFPPDLRLWDTNTYLSTPEDGLSLDLWNPTLPIPDDTWDPWASNLQTDTLQSEDNSLTSAPQYTPLDTFMQGFTDLKPHRPNPVSITNDRPDLCWSTTLNCSCSRPHFQIQSDSPNALSARFKVTFLGPSSPPAAGADPYTNNLRVDQLCTLTALFSVVAAMGLCDEIVCANDAISQFYRPLNETAEISAVQRTFKFLKPDIRPTKDQVTIAHHPMIDIFPFPTLRNKLIRHQGEYDEDEFLHDSLSGLVCWGGGGVSQNDRVIFTGKVSTGTPWDFRSWEAQVWFLKKYWDLLGGEEGELVRQTEWWRAMRGDEELDLGGLAPICV